MPLSKRVCRTSIITGAFLSCLYTFTMPANTFVISRTGIVYNVTPHAVGVIVYKIVGNRYIEKRVNLRVEHIKHSKCRQEFLDRVTSNTEAHKQAKERGGMFICLFDFLEMTDLDFYRTCQPPTYPCSSS